MSLKNKLLLLAFTISIFNVQYSLAQNDSIKIEMVAKENKIWVGKSFLQDEAKLWTSPLRFNKKDWIVAVPVILSALVIIRYDESIHRGFMDFKSDHQWVKDVSPKITLAGDGRVIAPASALLYAGGLIFKDQKLQQTGALAMQALLHSAIISQVIKIITARQRPNADNGIDRWHWLPSYFADLKNGHIDPQNASDPSGHTIAAWTLASVIALQYKDQWAIPVLCYTTATLVGLSRVTQNAHWLSDVVVGAALGYGVAKYIVNKRAHTRWTLFPSSCGNNIMITANYKIL